MKELIQLSEAQKTEAIALGESLLTIDDLIICLELDFENAKFDMSNKESSLFKAYHTGRLKTIIAHRKSVIDIGKAGSSPAQGMVEKFISETEMALS